MGMADETPATSYYDTYGKRRIDRLSDPTSADSMDYSPENAEMRQAQYRYYAERADGREAPSTSYQNADFARALSMQARGQQGDAVNMYRDAALGNGPSVAQASFGQALAAQQRNQAALAASARGGGLARAAAQRQAMVGAADMGVQSAGAMAALRATEVAQARAGMLAGASQMRAGDAGQQGQDAEQAKFLTNTQLAQQAANDARMSYFETQKTHLADQVFQGQLAKQNAIEGAVSMDQTQQKINAGAQDATSDREARTAVGAASTAVSLVPLLASDRRAKKDIKPADAKAQSFLDALKAADYEYKNPNTPTTSPGRHTSVMAQDLEKSELGRRMVHDTPDGKVVDYKEGFATALAAMATMNKRIDSLEALLAARAKGRK